MLKRILAALFGFGFCITAGGAAFVGFAGDPTYELAPTGISASTDAAKIERGRYLFHGAMHCTVCHAGSWEEGMTAGRGVELTPSGGQVWDIAPMMVFRSANLTSDKETGIGAKSDEHIARVIKYGVGEDGKLRTMMALAVPNAADEDIEAILSYLRSLKAVKNDVPPSEMRFMGRMLVAFGLFGARPQTAPDYVPRGPEPSIARGRYLADGPAHCENCHSPYQVFDLGGPPFSGGLPHDATGAPEMELAAPNLTPDPDTGRITSWSEDVFLTRMKAGFTDTRTYMPWGNYAYMTDHDLRSIYRYLRSLEPVRNEVGPSIRVKGWEPSE